MTEEYASVDEHVSVLIYRKGTEQDDSPLDETPGFIELYCLTIGQDESGAIEHGIDDGYFEQTVDGVVLTEDGLKRYEEIKSIGEGSKYNPRSITSDNIDELVLKIGAKSDNTYSKDIEDSTNVPEGIQQILMGFGNMFKRKVGDYLPTVEYAIEQGLICPFPQGSPEDKCDVTLSDLTLTDNGIERYQRLQQT